MRLNILFMIDCMGYGGTERQLEELINGLDKAHFNAHICTLKLSFALFDELDCNKSQLLIPRLLHPAAIAQYRALVGLLRKWDIHLVHTFFQDSFAVGALVKQFYPISLMGSFRDMGFWRTPRENFKMRMAYRAFDGFIANSEAVKEHFVMTDNLSPDLFKVIYNGYNGNNLSKAMITQGADADNAADTFMVGIVANFTRPVKRLEDFLRAAEIAWLRDASLQFTVVGAVGDFYDEAVKRAQGVMGSALKFTGRVPNPLDYIKGFNAGVITSETEGFCNAIIEYMACGLPVVATDGGGNRELVKDGVNGFLVPVNDPQEMAYKIVLLRNDPQLRRQMGEVNKQEVQYSYSVDRMIREHEEYYDEIVSRRIKRHAGGKVVSIGYSRLNR